MVVRTQSNGNNDIGVRVGTANVRRYFSRSSDAVELKLDDLQIQCRLPETFWKGQPEIFDPRLCEWLKFKVLRERRNAPPIALKMVQSGTNSFTLQSIPPVERRANRLMSAA
jgi:hypothetical protein